MVTRTNFTIAAVAALAGIAVLVIAKDRRHDTAPAAAIHSIARRIYPYSVIPGGAQSPAELRDALLRDSVARDHYAGFDARQVRVERLPKARQVYVSYRVGNLVYWTGRRIRLPAGETILTDGVNSARTRCGNRIAETRQSPVSAAEPAEQAFNSPWTEQSPPEPALAPDEEQDAPDGVDRLPGADQPGEAADPNDYLAKFGPAVFLAGPHPTDNSGGRPAPQARDDAPDYPFPAVSTDPGIPPRVNLTPTFAPPAYQLPPSPSLLSRGSISPYQAAPLPPNLAYAIPGSPPSPVFFISPSLGISPQALPTAVTLIESPPPLETPSTARVREELPTPEPRSVFIAALGIVLFGAGLKVRRKWARARGSSQTQLRLPSPAP